METIPQTLREAVEDLTRIGKDPNHTDEDLKKAMKRVHEERERAIVNSREYADMLRRKAEAQKRETAARSTDLPNSAVLRHGRRSR